MEFFTENHIESLFKRLTQPTEELLYCKNNELRERYNYHQRGHGVLGVAHCDYVSDAWSAPRRKDNIIQCGQVDDRVGVWLLLDVLPSMGMEFDVLLTTDEEIGQSTASEAAIQEYLEYNWTFQFDRRGTDFVDYQLASEEFRNEFRLTTGINHAMGSFSDICSLPDSCGSRVNIGTGYYGEHRPTAYVDLNHCWSQVSAFKLFFDKHKETRFEFFDKLKTNDDDYDWDWRPSKSYKDLDWKWSLKGDEYSSDDEYLKH